MPACRMPTRGTRSEGVGLPAAAASPPSQSPAAGEVVPFVGMGRVDPFVGAERARQAAWKRSTATLPDAARVAAPYLGRETGPSDRTYEFCLPPQYATLSLLPEVRADALALFAELGIPWHASVGGGPSNHLLDSQVQCVNALGQMVADPTRIEAVFGSRLGVGQVLEVEPGRFLTFEYIGPSDVFGESPGRKRTRGSKCTSVDAAFLHRHVDGFVELVLIEWKYTESYRPHQPDPRGDETRRRRYAPFLTAADSPVDHERLAFGDFLDEPLYQLMRQQLLAHELEKTQVLGAERVRVVHVLPKANLPYQRSLTRPSQLALGAAVSEVWSLLLRQPDRFMPLDSTIFLDPTVTSAEYVARYGPAPSTDEPKP